LLNCTVKTFDKYPLLCLSWILQNPNKIELGKNDWILGLIGVLFIWCNILYKFFSDSLVYYLYLTKTIYFFNDWRLLIGRKYLKFSVTIRSELWGYFIRKPAKLLCNIKNHSSNLLHLIYCHFAGICLCFL